MITIQVLIHCLSWDISHLNKLVFTKSLKCYSDHIKLFIYSFYNGLLFINMDILKVERRKCKTISRNYILYFDIIPNTFEFVYISLQKCTEL